MTILFEKVYENFLEKNFQSVPKKKRDEPRRGMNLFQDMGNAGFLGLISENLEDALVEILTDPDFQFQIECKQNEINEVENQRRLMQDREWEKEKQEKKKKKWRKYG